MKIYKSIDELVGRTPLAELVNFSRGKDFKAQVCAKLEFFNPAGSVKDRAALYMIRDAEDKGLLKDGSVIIEPTSGNTGIGLAAVAASKGYKVVLTMPDTMSVERVNLLKAFGAEIILTQGALGMKGAIQKAEELLNKTPGSYMPGQFTNEANAKAHYETTGPEIWQDTDAQVDVFVAGVGTGGTLTGTARYLKEMNPHIEIVAVEPLKSPLLSKGEAGPHGLQGIGANFVPQILDREIIDRIVPVAEEDAFKTCKELSRTEGYLVGISSGAALYAAATLAKEEKYSSKRIVVLLPDTGERYLSTGIFD